MADAGDIRIRIGRLMSDFYCDEVLSGKLMVDVAHETDDTLAFHHTRPSYPTHIVVVPKRHIPSFVDLGDADEAVLARVIAVVRNIAASVLEAEGACRVITNLGRYQDSKHLHFHVVSGDRSDLDPAGPVHT